MTADTGVGVAERYVASFIVLKRETQNSYSSKINNCASPIPAWSGYPFVSWAELSVDDMVNDVEPCSQDWKRRSGRTTPD